MGSNEIYREKISGSLDLERATLHISDDTGRIALVDTKTYDGGVIGSPTNEIRYQIGNHLQSASLELDNSAAIISYEEFHAFGTSAYRLGSSSTEVAQKRYRYVGKECDNETGMYYYGARYYAAWLCRFVSVDPRKDDYPMWSSFVYAGNMPVTMTDVNGEGPGGGGGGTQLVETTITLDDGTTQTIMTLPEVVITPEVSDLSHIQVSGMDSLPNDNTTVVMPMALNLPTDSTSTTESTFSVTATGETLAYSWKNDHRPWVAGSQTWYYMYRDVGAEHAMVYDPVNEVIYEINGLPEVNTLEQLEALLINSMSPNFAQVRVSVAYMYERDNEKEWASLWEREVGTVFLLSPVTVTNPEAATDWFRGQEGNAWPYNLSVNNCADYSCEGLNEGGGEINYYLWPSWFSNSPTMIWTADQKDPVLIK